jgi:hypothetical protein
MSASIVQKELFMVVDLKEINGFFNISEQEFFGNLKIQDENTLLTLKSKVEIPPTSELNFVMGTGFDHKIISCLECIDAGFQTNFHNSGTEFSASIFPHYVVIGDASLNTEEITITGIHFTTNDLPTIFNDQSAFGHIFSTKEDLTSVLTQHHEKLEKNFKLGYELSLPKIAENPNIFYFTGNSKFYECTTDIGLLTVNHSPSISVDGKTGVICENNITASLNFDEPVNFKTAIDRMSTLSRFFSIVAGQSQKSFGIKIEKTGLPANSYLDIYCSYNTLTSAIPLPNSHDTPLNPIRRPEEFSHVLKNWIKREPEWRVGRTQYLNGLSKGRSYDTDRLVSAANAFDILPSSATVPDSLVTADHEDARNECIKILKTLPPTEDRAAAIGVLKRWGRANLRSKVLHRAKIVKLHIPSIPDEIDDILVLAIKNRNYFVHGSSDFNYEKYGDFLTVFTDALEFIFSASDLIECGWDPKAWLKTRPSFNHNFGYFLRTIPEDINQIKTIKLNTFQKPVRQ